MPNPAIVDVYCDDAHAAEHLLQGFVRARGLFRRVRRIGLAVSGGADSVSLFHLMVPLCRAHGVEVAVLHADHGLRPDSAADATFVRALAESAGLPFLFGALRVNEQKRAGESIEMAARAARHDFFADCCRRAALDAIATGHQADDLAESLLLRLTRGAGCAGLSALLPRSPAAPALAERAGRPYAIIRPLLALSAHALRDWLATRGLSWREDGSNSCLAIPRNRLRHEALPHFEAAWGQPVRAALCRSADILREEDALLEALAERRMEAAARSGALDLRTLARMPLAVRRRVIRRWLISRGQPDTAGYDTVARLLAASAQPSPAPLQLNERTCAVFRNGQLALEFAEQAPPPDAPLPLRGSFLWGRLEIHVEPFCGMASEAHGVGRYPAVCALCATRLAERPLVVRARRTGDYIAPTGLRGSKKLQDLFVDAKLPRAARDAVPVFACGADVAWVPGYRVSRLYAVPAPDAASVRISVREPT